MKAIYKSDANFKILNYISGNSNFHCQYIVWSENYFFFACIRSYKNENHASSHSQKIFMRCFITRIKKKAKIPQKKVNIFEIKKLKDPKKRLLAILTLVEQSKRCSRYCDERIHP